MIARLQRKKPRNLLRSAPIAATGGWKRRVSAASQISELAELAWHARTRQAEREAAGPKVEKRGLRSLASVFSRSSLLRRPDAGA